MWSADPALQQEIGKWLGWMSSPMLMADSIDRLQTFAASIKRNGFTDVVLLGMGGSSLAPEVLRAVIGAAPGWPRLHMLDSTDPAAVRAVTTAPDRTLYLLASKSGTTIEPNSLAAHFRQRLQDAGVPRWADHFVAITDHGTELERRAREEHFRDVFINPSDIGGRYSALSFFGMVPAALMGQDVVGDHRLVAGHARRLGAGRDGAAANPSVALGLVMGAGARDGRDKLTLVVPPALDAFGLWIEQLIAESTGKNGVGIVPIAGEPLADAAAYGTDRLFVRMRVHDAAGEDARDAGVRAIKESGRPGRRDRSAGAAGAGRRIHALGNRDRGRGRAPRDQPVRSAERAAGEGRHQGAADGIQDEGTAADCGAGRDAWRDRADPDRGGAPGAGGPRRRIAADAARTPATTSRCSRTWARIRRWPPRCRRGAGASAIARAWRRCSATDRATCIRPDSCTRAAPTAACSC